MENEASATEFPDWELLHEYDDISPQVYSSFPDSNARVFQVTEGDSGSGSTIWLDYFSLCNHEPSSKTAPKSTVSNECLVDSENLDSIDSDLENRNCRKNTSELGSDLGDEYELNQSHANGLPDITKNVTGFEEISTDAENLDGHEADDGKLKGSPLVTSDEPLSGKDMYNPTESEESGEGSESQDKDSDDSYSNSCGNESVAMKSGDDRKESDTGRDHIDSVNDISNNDLDGGDGDSSEKIDVAMAVEEVKVEAKSGELETQRRRVEWWKVPFQVLRYCFLRANPAWSFSVAAAFMGMVILGRRLYKMKRKAKSLHLKIAVDDKEVSKFADRAARLNEAFSMVRRVPVVRGSLTGAGANSWLAMSMR